MLKCFKKTDNSISNFKKANFIVFLFVIAHAVSCYFSHDTDFGDSLILTILTIAMVYSLIRFYGIPFDIFLGIAFLSCFAGFYLGTQGAKLLTVWAPELGVWINVIMTSVVTEVLGLIIIFLVRKGWRSDKSQ
jgi:uncharacterized protein (DUF697 family)